jgi:hypothetical protein
MKEVTWYNVSKNLQIRQTLNDLFLFIFEFTVLSTHTSEKLKII